MLHGNSIVGFGQKPTIELVFPIVGSCFEMLVGKTNVSKSPGNYTWSCTRVDLLPRANLGSAETCARAA